MIHFKFILLEWESDEVYGDYLIEDNEETTKISYFRFYHKFKTFSLPKKSYSERETWIIKNAINQDSDPINIEQKT